MSFLFLASNITEVLQNYYYNECSPPYLFNVVTLPCKNKMLAILRFSTIGQSARKQLVVFKFARYETDRLTEKYYTQIKAQKLNSKLWPPPS